MGRLGSMKGVKCCYQEVLVLGKEARGAQRRREGAGFSDRLRENITAFRGYTALGSSQAHPSSFPHKHFLSRLASSSRSLPQGFPWAHPLPIPSWPPRNRLLLMQHACCHMLSWSENQPLEPWWGQPSSELIDPHLSTTWIRQSWDEADALCSLLTGVQCLSDQIILAPPGSS